MADIKADTNKGLNPDDPVVVWEEDDFSNLGLDKYGIDIRDVTGETKLDKYFRLFEEKWEKDYKKKKNHAPGIVLFLDKYGGIKWYHPDDPSIIVTADGAKLAWHSPSGRARHENPRGHQLRGLLPTFDYNKPKDEDVMLTFIDEALFYRIKEFYEDPQNKLVYAHIKLVYPEVPLRAPRAPVAAVTGESKEDDALEPDTPLPFQEDNAGP